jgi:hypothetical protein
VGEAIGILDGPLLGVFGILIYGILANVFYTGGWIAELALRTVPVYPGALRPQVFPSIEVEPARTAG